MPDKQLKGKQEAAEAGADDPAANDHYDKVLEQLEKRQDGESRVQYPGSHRKNGSQRYPRKYNYLDMHSTDVMRSGTMHCSKLHVCQVQLPVAECRAFS